MIISARSAKKATIEIIELKHVILLHDYSVIVESEKNGVIARGNYKKRVIAQMKAIGHTPDSFNGLLSEFSAIEVDAKHRNGNSTVSGNYPLLSYAFDKCNSLEWKY